MEMEYSLFRLGMRVLLFLIGVILYIIYVIRKREFLIGLFYEQNKFGELYKGKNDLLFFRIVNILIIVVLLMIGTFVMKAAMDIPYILNNNYSYITGYTKGDSKGGANVSIERRSIFLQNEQMGKEIEITIFSNYIEDNTYVEVEYLPHTRYGAIVKKGK